MGKILIVDDDVAFRDSCYSILNQDGHHVLTYPFGSKLNMLIRQERPDLVLVDAEAAGEQGMGLLRSLQAHPEWKVPAVAFSTQLEPDDEKKIYQAGALDILQKTTDAGKFCLRINKILSAKHRIFKEAQEIRNIKILVVDDETPLREMVGVFFEKKGFRTFLAANGEEALWMVQKEKPNIILMDVTMPGMDGILALKKIREMDSRANVIMACGVPDEKIMRQAYDLGAGAYILKPFDLQYLEVLVMTKLMTADAAGHG